MVACRWLPYRQRRRWWGWWPYADPLPDLDRRSAYRLTQAQAADLLGISTARVAELVGEGRLTPVAKWVQAGPTPAEVASATLTKC